MQVVITIYDIEEAKAALEQLAGSAGIWLCDREHHPGELMDLSRPVDGVMRHWGAMQRIGIVRIEAVETPQERQERLGRERAKEEARQRSLEQIKAEVMKSLDALIKVAAVCILCCAGLSGPIYAQQQSQSAISDSGDSARGDKRPRACTRADSFLGEC